MTPTQIDWNQCYQTGDTPWDKGAPAPLLPVLLEKAPALFQGRVLVPGCGTGQDARFLAAQGAKVVAVDIASLALERARKLDPTGSVEWRQADLFDMPNDLLGKFDRVWEHTCLSALEPPMRTAYAIALKSALKPGGSLYGVFYINPDMDPGESGPPFGIPTEELMNLWESAGLEIKEHWVPDVAYEGRAGRELFLWAVKPE